MSYKLQRENSQVIFKEPAMEEKKKTASKIHKIQNCLYSRSEQYERCSSSSQKYQLPWAFSSQSYGEEITQTMLSKRKNGTRKPYVTRSLLLYFHAVIYIEHNFRASLLHHNTNKIQKKSLAWQRNQHSKWTFNGKLKIKSVILFSKCQLIQTTVLLLVINSTVKRSQIVDRVLLT